MPTNEITKRSTFFTYWMIDVVDAIGVSRIVISEIDGLVPLKKQIDEILSQFEARIVGMWEISKRL